MPVQNTIRARFSRHQRGAALVEYAFVVIVLFSFIFGISGFGHALYVYHAINNSAKEGTRWAAVNGYLCGTNTGGDNTCNGTNGMNNGPATTTDIINYVTANLPASLQSSNAKVNAQFLSPSGSPPACTTTVGTLPAAEPNYPGCSVQVTIGYAYAFYFPLIPVTTNVSPNCAPNPGYCFLVTSEMIIAH
jgi:Flp pilus assembly protein TadG